MVVLMAFVHLERVVIVPLQRRGKFLCDRSPMPGRGGVSHRNVGALLKNSRTNAWPPGTLAELLEFVLGQFPLRLGQHFGLFLLDVVVDRSLELTHAARQAGRGPWSDVSGR